MKRDPLMSEAYFDDLIGFYRQTVAERDAKLSSMPPSLKKPQVLARSNLSARLSILLGRYSRGDAVDDLVDEFEPIVSGWERALSFPESSANDLAYLDDYVRTLWLLSLALIFRADDAVWQRLITCVGNEGRDALVERLIACRTAGRQQAAGLLHPKVYALLNQAASAGAPEHIRGFLAGWYSGLDDVGWHDCHKGPEGGGYVGYWAIEAAGVVVAFGMDDTACREMPHYPRDLADFGKLR